VGPISQGLNCLFVDRTNEENKKQIFDSLLERQTAFYEGTLFSPMVNFPEGTCSCCRNILRFKKGPFYALLPVKPMILKINQRSSFHLSVGASNVVLHYVKNLCHFMNTIDYTILPTIRPVDYIFEHNQNLGKEKWQIFANTVRKIYSEVGGLIEANMGMRDLNRYIKAMRTGFYDPFEDMDFEHKNKNKDDDNIIRDSISDENFGPRINTISSEPQDIIDIREKEEKENDVEVKKDEDYEKLEDNDKEEKLEDNNKEDNEENKKKEEDNNIDNNKNEIEEKLI